MRKCQTLLKLKCVDESCNHEYETIINGSIESIQRDLLPPCPKCGGCYKVDATLNNFIKDISIKRIPLVKEYTPL